MNPKRRLPLPAIAGIAVHALLPVSIATLAFLSVLAADAGEVPHWLAIALMVLVPIAVFLAVVGIINIHDAEQGA